MIECSQEDLYIKEGVMSDSRVKAVSSPSSEMNAPSSSSAFVTSSFPAIIRRLASPFLGRTQAFAAQSYDAKMPSDLKEVIEELNKRKRNLESKLNILKRNFEIVRDCYSIAKLQSYTDEAVADIERKKQSDIFCRRSVAPKIQWKITDKPKETKTEDKRLEVKTCEPEIFSAVTLEVIEIENEVKELNNYKELRESLDPAIMLRAAVKRYVERCNVLFIHERPTSIEISKYTTEAKIFNCVSDVTYDQKLGKFRYNHRMGAYTHSEIINSFNTDVLGEAKAETSLAYMCFNEEAALPPVYKKIYSVDRKRVPVLEVTPDYTASEAISDSLKHRVLVLMKKVIPFKDSEKKISDKYFEPMNTLSTAFLGFEHEFETDYKELGIEDFAKNEKYTMQKLYNELDRVVAILKEEMEESKTKCSTLSLFQDVIDRIKIAQRQLNERLVIFQEQVQEKLPQFRLQYDGPGVIKKINLSHLVEELQTLSDEPLNRVSAIQSTLDYAEAITLYAEKMAMMDALKFLQEHILSAAKLKSFWKYEVRGIDLGCFAIGGSRVRLADNTSVLVPHGIAMLYEKIHRINFKTITDEQMVELFKESKDCIQRRINRNCGISLSRKDPTTQQFYNLFTRLPEFNVTAESIDFFKDGVSKIMNSRGSFLVSEISYANGDAVVRTSSERKA